MQRPPGSELQKQTLWLYGVLVGLAIKEAIVGVFDHVTTQERFWGGSFETIRLFLFLLIIVRFYLGSVQYFYGVYSSPTADQDYPDKSFRSDFLFGFMHFIILSILGLTATLHDSKGWLFPIILAFVLSYDVLWYLWSRNLSTKKALRLWTVINVFTVAVGLLLFCVSVFVCMWWFNERQMALSYRQRAYCEMIAYIPVFLASSIDLGSLLHDRSAIEEWLSEAIHRPKILGGHAT